MARKQKDKEAGPPKDGGKAGAGGKKADKGKAPPTPAPVANLLAPVPLAALADPCSRPLVRKQFEQNSSCFVKLGKGPASEGTLKLWRLLRAGGTCKVGTFAPWVDMMAAIIMHLLPDGFVPEGKWQAPAVGGGKKSGGKKNATAKVTAEEFIAALKDPEQRTVTVTARDYTGNSKIVPEHFDNAVLTTIITVSPGAATGAQLHVYPTAEKEWVSCDDGPCPDPATVVVSAGRHLQYVTGDPRHAPCLHKVTHEGSPDEYDKTTSRTSVAVSITAFAQLDHPKVPATGKALLIEDVGV